MTVSLALLMVIVSGIFAGGVALAVPIAGIGGFTIEADEILIEDFTLFPKVGQTSEKKGVPQVGITMDGVLKNMRLYKDLSMPGGGTFRILITADRDVTTTGLLLDFTNFKADTSFKKLTIKEQASSDYRKKFGMIAPHLRLGNPKINGHYLFADTITLPGMGLKVETISK